MLIPEDGCLPKITRSGLSAFNNVMIIKIPEKFRKPGEMVYQLATLDPSKQTERWPADKYLDKSFSMQEADSDSSNEELRENKKKSKTLNFLNRKGLFEQKKIKKSNFTKSKNQEETQNNETIIAQKSYTDRVNTSDQLQSNMGNYDDAPIPASSYSWIPRAAHKIPVFLNEPPGDSFRRSKNIGKGLLGDRPAVDPILNRNMDNFPTFSENHLREEIPPKNYHIHHRSEEIPLQNYHRSEEIPLQNYHRSEEMPPQNYPVDHRADFAEFHGPGPSTSNYENPQWNSFRGNDFHNNQTRGPFNYPQNTFFPNDYRPMNTERRLGSGPLPIRNGEYEPNMSFSNDNLRDGPPNFDCYAYDNPRAIPGAFKRKNRGNQTNSNFNQNFKNNQGNNYPSVPQNNFSNGIPEIAMYGDNYPLQDQERNYWDNQQDQNADSNKLYGKPENNVPGKMPIPRNPDRPWRGNKNRRHPYRNNFVRGRGNNKFQRKRN